MDRRKFLAAIAAIPLVGVLPSRPQKWIRYKLCRINPGEKTATVLGKGAVPTNEVIAITVPRGFPTRAGLVGIAASSGPGWFLVCGECPKGAT